VPGLSPQRAAGEPLGAELVEMAEVALDELGDLRRVENPKVRTYMA